MVAQEFTLEFDFTVLEMVMIGRTPHKRSFDRDDDSDHALADQAIRQVGCQDLAYRGFNTLSGGEKQRVLIAQAIAQGADHLILDEPTSHLDIRYQVEILELVATLGITVLAAIHDLSLAALFCDTVHLIADGHLIAGGPPGSVLTADTIRDAYGTDVLVIAHPETGTPHLIPRRSRTTQAPSPRTAHPPVPPAGSSPAMTVGAVGTGRNCRGGWNSWNGRGGWNGRAVGTVTTNTRGPSDALRGILLMCAGVSSFPFMNAGVKLLADSYPASQITWARFHRPPAHHACCVPAEISLDTAAYARHPFIQVGRSVAMLLSNLLFVMAIGQVPLATASAIGFTSPLIVTALSVPLLHESVGWRRWSAVVVGFAGALMVIRPGTGFRDPGVLLILLSSLIYALYQIGTRSVGRHDSAATGIIFAALLGSLGMTLVMPFVFVMPRTLFDGLLFCSLGLLGGFGHYLIIRAFQLGLAAVIAPLGYVELDWLGRAWLPAVREFP